MLSSLLKQQRRSFPFSSDVYTFGVLPSNTKGSSFVIRRHITIVSLPNVTLEGVVSSCKDVLRHEESYDKEVGPHNSLEDK